MRRVRGTSGLDTAEICFAENLELFGNPPEVQAEKFNLYNGLRQMVIGMQKMEAEIMELKKEVEELKRRK